MPGILLWAFGVAFPIAVLIPVVLCILLMRGCPAVD